ncbi:mitochondrial intermediate peptidase [Physcia stellaris]|nr:mitochondrial intermediate peptidase [Physcia stellaris]
MCHKIVEEYKCKHRVEIFIPCEGMPDTGTCTAKPEDTQDIVNKNESDCPKCQAKHAEEAELQEILKQIEEDPALAPEPKTAIKPTGDFGTYRCRKKYKKCGHYDSPRDSGLEREHPNDPEWLDEDEPGYCFKCSELHPSVYAELRARGELDGDDPHGALNPKKLEPAAGGSANAAAGPKHPAFDIPDDDDGEHFVRTRSPSPDQIPTLTRGKGKGRASKPEETYASRHGAAEPAVPEYDSDAGHEDDSAVHSGDEEQDKAPKGKGPKYALSDDEENYDDEEEEEEEEEEEPIPRGRKVRKHGVGSSSRGSSSKSGTQRHRLRSTSSDYSHDEEDGIPDWSSQPPPGGPPPPMASGALRPPPRNPARRNARVSDDE